MGYFRRIGSADGRHLIPFAPTFGAEFIKWGDQFYVGENPLLREVAGLAKRGT